MRYSIRIKQSALKEIEKIDKPTRFRIVKAIDELAENPHVGKALKGHLSGLRRIRVGNYRIVYEINQGEVLVLVLRVSHRSQAYR